MSKLDFKEGDYIIGSDYKEYPRTIYRVDQVLPISMMDEEAYTLTPVYFRERILDKKYRDHARHVRFTAQLEEHVHAFLSSDIKDAIKAMENQDRYLYNYEKQESDFLRECKS